MHERWHVKKKKKEERMLENKTIPRVINKMSFTTYMSNDKLSL